MSWLYTIVFAGLVFSSQGSDVSPERCSFQNPPLVASQYVADETEKFEKSFPLNANGRVNISNVNGSITVEAWDRNEVKLEYTKVADTRERLADVEVKIESRQDSFSVETDYSYSKSRNAGDRDFWKGGGKLNVEFRLTVPRGAVLNEVETVNGSVTVSNFVNVTMISAVNGSVNASNIRGTAKLSTVNGAVTADFDRLETGSKISLETVNGRVNLIIPSDVNATIKAESLNGTITNEFALPVRKRKYIGRDLHGKLGSGDVQIRMESVNGGLSIGRKNDGKTLSPATNLLDQKSNEDNDDWDLAEVKPPGKIAKIDKQIAKSMKDVVKLNAANTRIAEKALAEAQVELRRIQPELDKIQAEAMANAPGTLAKTADLINPDAIRESLRQAQRVQRDMMGIMSDVIFSPSIPRVETKSDSFPVKGVPKVTVTAKGGSVVVRGWDKQEVQYKVTQFADPQNGQPINLKEDHSDSAVNITVENLAYTRNGRSLDDMRRVRIEIFVPRKTNLKIEADGTVRLEGVSGDLQIVGDDQSIDVRDSEGKLNVSNADGQIRIIGFTGELVAKTNDGTIRMDGDFTAISGQSVDGKFVLTVPDDVDADIAGSGKQGFALTIEDIESGKQVSKDNWKFGMGSRKYRFTAHDGSLLIQSRDLLAAQER